MNCCSSATGRRRRGSRTSSARLPWLTSAGRRSRCGCWGARRTRRPRRAGRRSLASSASPMSFASNRRSIERGSRRRWPGQACSSTRARARRSGSSRSRRLPRGCRSSPRIPAACRRFSGRIRTTSGASSRSTIPKRWPTASSERWNDAPPSIRLALRASVERRFGAAYVAERLLVVYREALGVQAGPDERRRVRPDRGRGAGAGPDGGRRPRSGRGRRCGSVRCRTGSGPRSTS